MASITLTAPGSGQVWLKGQTKTISWSTTDVSYMAAITVQLRESGSFDSTITTTATNYFGYGSINWTIPTTLTSSAYYRIRVFPTGTSGIYDDSSNISIIGRYIGIADQTQFSADTVASAFSDKWRHPYSPSDSTAFSESVATDTDYWYYPKTASDTTAFTETVATAIDKWRHYYTIPDATAFSADSVSTAKSLWRHPYTPGDATAFTETVSTFLQVQPKPSDETAFTEAIGTALSLWRHTAEDDTVFTESVSYTHGRDSRMYQLDSGSDHENYSTSRSSGWIKVGPLNKNPVIRDINMKYKSSDAINIKIYADDNTSTAVFDKDFSASSSTIEKNIRVGKRARVAMLTLSTPVSYNYDMEVEKLEMGISG
jgi:hypothetical protein